MLRALPAFLACFVLTAHFLRAGQLLMAVMTLVLPWTLLTKRTWALRATQTALAVGVLVWIVTLVGRAQERMAEGKPWLRLAAILIACAVFTAWSAWFAGSGPARQRYRD